MGVWLVAYTEEQIKPIFEKIIQDIEINCMSTRKAVKNAGISSETFYKWIQEENRAKRYAHACIERCEGLADEIIDIADDKTADKIIIDGTEITNHEAINRSRLKIDSRKWLLSKLYAKKYGDKLDITSDNEKITQSPISIIIDSKDIKLK